MKNRPFLLLACVLWFSPCQAQWLEAGPGTPVQLLHISIHEPAQIQRLEAMGVDLSEHAGPHFVEALIYSPRQTKTLRDAGFAFSVRIPDMLKRDIENRRADAGYAKTTAVSPLPSGRTGYRHLADYEAELRQLASDHPDSARLLVLKHQSLEGRDVLGIEISEAVNANDDGKPVFLLMGVHHAREWPSGETSMEFAIDLLKSHRAGDARIRKLLKSTRVIVVPIVNPDGFNVSRVAGDLLDLSGTPAVTTIPLVLGATVNAVFLAPGGAYKRKNCRLVDGQMPMAGSCGAAAFTGGTELGVDNNRNYATNWGGELNGGDLGDTIQTASAYVGAAPFSEPETQNIRELIRSRQVTTLVSTHTFAGLTLRVPGVQTNGITDDDAAITALGHQMAAQNGSVSKPWWQLYDARGIVEDWSYGVTGGYGYTYELGVTEFHPAFTQTIDNYLGAGAYAGKGTRGAYLLAAEAAADTQQHGVLQGETTPGMTLRLRKQFDTLTNAGIAVPEQLESSLVVPASGRFDWHVNPSTRPELLPHYAQVPGVAGKTQEVVINQMTLPEETVDVDLLIPEPTPEALEIRVSWPAVATDSLQGNFVLDVFFRDDNGGLTFVRQGSYSDVDSIRTETVLLQPQPGHYVLRIRNFFTTAQSFTVTTTERVLDKVLLRGSDVQEAYTLSCETASGTVLQTMPVTVTRGEVRTLAPCPCLPAASCGAQGPVVPPIAKPPVAPPPATPPPATPPRTASVAAQANGRFGGSLGAWLLLPLLVGSLLRAMRRASLSTQKPPQQ